MKTISRVSFFFLVTMFVLSVFVLIFLETQLLLAQNFGDVESREWREKYHVNDSLSIKYLKGEISGKGSGRKPFLRAFDSYYKRANSNGEIPTNYLWQQNELLNQTFPGFGTVSNGKGGNSLNDAANWQEVGTGQLLQLSMDFGGNNACNSGTLFSQTGRITSLAIDPTNANILYAGSASGGVWKTTNGGGSWFSSWNNIPNCSIGAIALRPGNPNEILVGTGENGGSGLSFGGFNGIGLVKSTDGGASWTQVPSLSAGYSGGLAFYRVAYNPANPNRILCATNQGLRLSTDNGTSWTSLTCSPAGSLPGFAVNSNASDVIVNPVDASKVVASFWGIGMFFSSDSGNTWSASNINSNSTMNIGRIKLCWVTAAGYTNQAYAVIANSSNSQLLGLYKTTNFGQTWSLTGTNTNITGNQSSYAMAIMTDRGDANTLYVGGLDLYRSGNAGNGFNKKSEWTALKDLLNDDDDYVHADQHVIIQHPTDHNTFFIGCDGGVFKTTDDFDNFTTLNNGLAVLQIVGIGIEQSSIYENLICGSQDNGVLRFDGSSWRVARSGDGGFCEIDYTDPQKCYSEYVNFTPMKSENFGCDFDNKDDGISYNNATIKVADGRTNFYSPLVLHPTNPAVLYGGTYRIWRTNNAMDNWNAISGDLTKGGTAVISAIAVSPTEIHRIYTGANDGRVCRTDNQYGTVSVPGSSSLVDITGNLPAKNVTSIAVDPNDSGTIYVTFSSFNNNSNIGFVFKSTNADTSVGTAVVWQNITPTLSGGIWNLPVNSVALDGNNVYIGTDLGVFFSTNSGNTWQQFNDNLPKVSVSQLRINYFTGYLYAATIGRGVWKTQLSRPDLVHEFPLTWTDAIVPKTTSDALFDDCVVSNELTSNSSSTFINFALRNAGIGESGGHTNKLFLDRVPISTQSIGDGLPSGTRTLNKGPFEVRGGRHTIADSIDVGNLVPESNETNNYYQKQFVWEPKPLALVSSIQRDAPPIKGNGINPNCDGFSYKYPSGTFAFGIALLPTAANPSGDTEVDLTLYEDYYSSQSGFSNAYGFSWLPNTESDFVLGTWNAVNDKNADGYSEFYPAVHGDLMSNYLYSTNSSPFQIQTTNSAGNLIASYPTTKTGENIVPEQILKLYEVYLSSGTAYQFLLTNVSGNADLGISIFTPGCGPICGKTEAVAVSDANGNGGNENLVYQAPISDWFMLAVWKKDTEDLTKDAVYHLNFRVAPANLLATTPTGWDSSIVARNDNFATSTSCFVSSSLNGNAAFSTYLNLGIRNSMLNTADPSNLKIYVDDVFAKTIPVGTVSGSTTVTLNNLLLEQEIKGGRHTILDSLDVENSVEETNETDNFAARQFVWSPYFVPLNYTLSRTAPPNPTSIGATFYNCDGFLNNLTASHWSAIGILPVNSGDDYDVRLYNDYTGSTTGFATPLVQSAFGNGNSDFVVVNTYVASGGNHYVGVSNSNSGTGNFTFYASQGNDLLLNNFANGPFFIGTSEVVRVFEIDLISGNTYHFILKTLSGNADLAFSLYDFADFDGLFSKSEAIAFANSNFSGDENFSLTAGVSGRFGLVVWKNSATDLFLESSFEILVSDAPLHAVNLKIIGLPPSLTTNVTFTRLGTPQTQSVSGTFANYADNSSYLEVQNPVNLNPGERFSSADQTNWVLTSSLVDTVNYAFRQLRNTFTPSVASGGTALGSGNTAVLVRTYNGTLSGAMLDGSTDVWVDENGTAEFLHITSGSTSSERWKLGESSASLSFGTITGSGNLYTATFYNQLKPSVTLNGTASTNTANVVSRISFGVPSPQSGVFGIWSEFCDRGTVLAFSDTTSLGWSTTDLVSGTVTDSFSGTINYVGSVLPAVSDLEIEQTGNDLVLSWPAVSGATSYRIYGSSTASVLPLAVNFIATVTGTSFTHVGAVSLGMFYYVVTSDNTTVTVSKQQNQNFEK